MGKKSDGGITRVKANMTPCCGYVVDSASPVTGDVSPEPEDLSLCLRCGAILQFATDLTLQMPGLGVLEGIRLTNPKLWDTLQTMQEAHRRVTKDLGTIPDRGGRS